MKKNYRTAGRSGGDRERSPLRSRSGRRGGGCSPGHSVPHTGGPYKYYVCSDREMTLADLRWPWQRRRPVMTSWPRLRLSAKYRLQMSAVLCKANIILWTFRCKIGAKNLLPVPFSPINAWMISTSDEKLDKRTTYFNEWREIGIFQGTNQNIGMLFIRSLIWKRFIFVIRNNSNTRGHNFRFPQKNI